MDVPLRSPLITHTTCPDCGSPRALMAYERPQEPIYFCARCEDVRKSVARPVRTAATASIASRRR